ncbi:iron donor protein CyaY, partial [Teladorsagia circumcincta]
MISGVCRPIIPRICRRGLCSTVSQADYEKAAEESLERLSDYLDTLPDKLQVSSDYDVTNAMGVLTVVISKQIGTYVINKQSPNRQLWLSSPISGPKRYDLVDRRFCLTDVAVFPRFYAGSDHCLLRPRFHVSMRVERAAKFWERSPPRAAGNHQLTPELAMLCREAIKEDLRKRRAAVLAEAAEAERSIRNARRSFASYLYKTKMTCLRRPDGTTEMQDEIDVEVPSSFVARARAEAARKAELESREKEKKEKAAASPTRQESPVKNAISPQSSVSREFGFEAKKEPPSTDEDEEDEVSVEIVPAKVRTDFSGFSKFGFICASIKMTTKSAVAESPREKPAPVVQPPSQAQQPSAPPPPKPRSVEELSSPKQILRSTQQFPLQQVPIEATKKSAPVWESKTSPERLSKQ